MATQMSPLRSQLGIALQQRYRSKRLAFHLYYTLANRETLKARQDTLLMLARNAERSAANDAIRLLRLNLPLPDEPAILWQRLLVICGFRVTMLWVEWQEKRLAHRFLHIFSINC